MVPVVILDTTALYGRNALSSANATLLLALAKIGEVTLVVPEVVLLELSRQWAEGVASAADGIASSIEKLNEALRDVAREPLVVDVTSLDRTVFYDHNAQLLKNKGAKIPAPPNVSAVDLMHRDLDVRKPFERSGRGFRDALTWETIKEFCVEQNHDPESLVVFVTNNHRDFCVKENGPLHADLREELHVDQRLDVVPTIQAFLDQPEIEPIVQRFRVFEDTFTPARLLELVDTAVTDLVGRDVAEALGVRTGDGMYSVPIYVGLDSPTFEEILIDEASITSDIYLVGDEFTIQVTVNAECSFDGYVDKSDYYAFVDEYDLSLYQDWNNHVFRAGARREVGFTLGGSFTEDTMENVVLTIDEATEV